MIPQFSKEVVPGFIAVEGLDGAGTTTQSALLERALAKAGHKTVLTLEPSHGPIGNIIKHQLRGRLNGCADPARNDRQLAYLFAADRHDHLYNATDGIVPLTQRGFTVITTRYHFSSWAYNARTPEDFEVINRLNCDFPLPQVVVYLTVPLEVSLARLAKRDVREFYEKEEELLRVSRNYEKMFDHIPERVVRAESVGDPEVVAAGIFDKVIALLR